LLVSLSVAAAGAVIAAPLSSAMPPPCPPGPLVYQDSSGNIYVSVPNPTGQTCRTTVELPGAIKPPPTLTR